MTKFRKRRSLSPRRREELPHPTTHQSVRCGIRLLATEIQVTGGAESEYTLQRGRGGVRVHASERSCGIRQHTAECSTRHPTTRRRDSSYRWRIRIHTAEGRGGVVFHAASDYSLQGFKLQVERNPNTHRRGERRSPNKGCRGERRSPSPHHRGESKATPQREVADCDYMLQSVPPGIRVQPQCPDPCGEASAETKWPARRFRKEQTKHCSIASNAPDTRLRESSSFLHVTLNPTHSTLHVVLLEFWSVFFDRGGFLGCRKRCWGEVEDVT